jgi:RNA polymerase sigma factor (sigma-70 family)
MEPSYRFATTRWSIVLAAGQSEKEASRAALETLCRAYWFPIYAYVRRRVAQPDDAQELTQSFFTALLERNALAAADPDRGRFRAFLLASCKNFLASHWEHQNAQKRGGGRKLLALDFVEGEERIQLEPADRFTPERWFERQWALTLLDRVLGLLRDEFQRDGRAWQFELLKGFLSGQEPPLSHAQLGAELGVSEGAARVIVHRLRRRYRELLRAEIAQTVSGEEEVDDEIRRLFAALES